MLRKIGLPGFAIILLFMLHISYRVRAEREPIFQVYGSSPVVAHGESGSWNEQYTDPGAVVVRDGTFYMFYNGFNGWPASVQIGYATSPDGIHWTKHGTEPVLRTAQVAYAGTAALASSVVVRDDGTWVLYFHTWESSSGSLVTSKGRIGRATAPGPDGPWSVDKVPVLEPGPAGTWDDLRVDAPSVLKTRSGFVMYYAGAGTSGTQSIGMATSTDGIHWKKFDDAATSEALYAASDPVFQHDITGTWDATRVHQPRVVQTPDGWVMLYRTVVAGRPTTIAIGIATSADGIHWNRSPHNPIFRADTDFGKNGFWYTAFAYQSGTYFAFVEAPPPGHPGETAVYVATYQGALNM